MSDILAAILEAIAPKSTVGKVIVGILFVAFLVFIVIEVRATVLKG